jgi:hypothetical protein
MQHARQRPSANFGLAEIGLRNLVSLFIAAAIASEEVAQSCFSLKDILREQLHQNVLIVLREQGQDQRKLLLDLVGLKFLAQDQLSEIVLVLG